MDFDFEKQYQSLSIAELLAIVRYPERYQPAAVDAAQRVLDSRSKAEIDAERERLYPAPKPLPQSDEISIFEETEPTYNPRHVAIMRNIVVGVYLYYLISGIVGIIPMFQLTLNDSLQTGFFVLLWVTAILGLYLVMALLIYQRKRIGWYLAMIFATLDFITRVGNSVTNVASGGGVVFSQLINVLFAGIVIFLLRTPALREDFRISDKAVRQTIGWSVAAALLLFLVRVMSTREF